MAPMIHEDNSAIMYANIAKRYRKVIDSPPMGVSYMNIG